MKAFQRKAAKATALFITFAAVTGCKQIRTTAYVATRQGLTNAEKQALQVEIAKVNASNLSASKKAAEKQKIFSRYFKLVNQPKF